MGGWVLLVEDDSSRGRVEEEMNGCNDKIDGWTATGDAVCTNTTIILQYYSVVYCYIYNCK